MTWAANAARAVGSFLMNNWRSVATLSAVGVNAYGQYQSGIQEQQAANLTAIQQETAAKQERAIAQIEVARRKRFHAAQRSEQQSLLASSGFSADDPTSLNLVSETVGAQTLEEMLTLAQGEETARQMEFAATQTRLGGRNARKNAKLDAVGTLATGGMSWYDRYGAGRRRPAGGSTPRRIMAG